MFMWTFGALAVSVKQTVTSPSAAVRPFSGETQLHPKTVCPRIQTLCLPYLILGDWRLSGNNLKTNIIITVTAVLTNFGQLLKLIKKTHSFTI